MLYITREVMEAFTVDTVGEMRVVSLKPNNVVVSLKRENGSKEKHVYRPGMALTFAQNVKIVLSEVNKHHFADGKFVCIFGIDAPKEISVTREPKRKKSAKRNNRPKIS